MISQTPTQDKNNPNLDIHKSNGAGVVVDRTTIKLSYVHEISLPFVILACLRFR